MPVCQLSDLSFMVAVNMSKLSVCVCVCVQHHGGPDLCENHMICRKGRCIQLRVHYVRTQKPPADFLCKRDLYVHNKDNTPPSLIWCHVYHAHVYTHIHVHACISLSLAHTCTNLKSNHPITCSAKPNLSKYSCGFRHVLCVPLTNSYP